MVRNVLVVAALLLTTLTASKAAADDPPEHLSKNAQKLIATLNSLGINSQEVRDLIEEGSSHVENGYLNLAKQKVMDGEMSIRYPLSASEGPFFTSRRLELNYTPQDSHFGVTARTDGVLATYKLRF